jgi:hypothetical protein
MTRFVSILLLAAACTPAPAADPHGSGKKASAASWHPSSPADASPRAVHVEPGATWKQATTAILGDACPGAVLVWGDLVVDDSLEPRAVSVAVGDGPVLLSGFLVCNAHMEAFLKMQTQNPHLVHGGSADLKWRDGQLWLRRRWSAVDVALGQLAPPPGDVFQKGETLAAIVSVGDPAAKPAAVLAAIARAPKVFLFAMLPL